MGQNVSLLSFSGAEAAKGAPQSKAEAAQRKEDAAARLYRCAQLAW
eukprot:SAG11_NODE_36526_length_261_cov_0.635802_1_plen_45_part_01